MKNKTHTIGFILETIEPYLSPEYDIYLERDNGNKLSIQVKDFNTSILDLFYLKGSDIKKVEVVNGPELTETVNDALDICMNEDGWQVDPLTFDMLFAVIEHTTQVYRKLKDLNE